jgi:hypothetical protein
MALAMGCIASFVIAKGFSHLFIDIGNLEVYMLLSVLLMSISACVYLVRSLLKAKDSGKVTKAKALLAVAIVEFVAGILISLLAMLLVQLRSD